MCIRDSVGLIVYSSVHATMDSLVTNAGASLAGTAAGIADTAVSLVRNAAAAGLAMAAADYGVQRRRVTKQLKMSRHDVKQEMKQTDGDPHLRGAIRRRQLALGRTRMIANVATADVVVVNPTHIAVALRYEPARGAPRVVAKGAGVTATRIREEAERRRVPTVQDVPLARALNRACEVNDPIPAELFTAVARVLAFVMALRARQPGLTPYRSTLAAPPQPVAAAG
jgi:flagellar biosynthetic protein FlhB